MMKISNDNSLQKVNLDGNSIKILNYISQNPACHLRQINRHVAISIGTAQYHLYLLEKSGKIISEKNNLHKFYFSAGLFSEKERNLLKILKQETSQKILMFILERKNPTQTAIVKNMKISAAAVNWHIKRLIERGIITEARDGKYRRYQSVFSSRDVVILLKNYHPDIWRQWSEKIAESFLSLSRDLIKN